MNGNSPKDLATKFAPILYLSNVAAAMEFYSKAFNATELRRWSNDDDSVHVAEMMIEDAVFHLHEEVERNTELNPHTLKGHYCCDWVICF